MIDGSGPGTAILLLILVLGILALAVAGVVVTRRHRRVVDISTAPPPLAPAPETEQLAAPGVETLEPPPAAEKVEEEGEEPAAAPEVVAPAPAEEAPPAPKRRVRSIGASLTRLFRGPTLSDAEWEDLEEILLRADVGVAATDRIVSALRTRRDLSDGLAGLREELVAVLGPADRTLHRKEDGLTVWLVTGVNGVGKTTTIGKLAAQLGREGSSVVLAAADTFRAAADEQLQRWADRSGAHIVRHAAGADPAAVVFDGVAAARARGASVLIVDTAGRLQTKRNLMDELSKIKRVLDREAGEPDEVLLVLDATTGQNGVQQARAFADAATVSGIVLTKLDGTAKGGIVVAVQQELGIPVKLVGVGEGIDDLSPFVPEDFVDDLLRQEPAGEGA